MKNARKFFWQFFRRSVSRTCVYCVNSVTSTSWPSNRAATASPSSGSLSKSRLEHVLTFNCKFLILETPVRSFLILTSPSFLLLHSFPFDKKVNLHLQKLVQSSLDRSEDSGYFKQTKVKDEDRNDMQRRVTLILSILSNYFIFFF